MVSLLLRVAQYGFVPPSTLKHRISTACMLLVVVGCSFIQIWTCASGVSSQPCRSYSPEIRVSAGVAEVLQSRSGHPGCLQHSQMVEVLHRLVDVEPERHTTRCGGDDGLRGPATARRGPHVDARRSRDDCLANNTRGASQRPKTSHTHGCPRTFSCSTVRAAASSRDLRSPTSPTAGCTRPLQPTARCAHSQQLSRGHLVGRHVLLRRTAVLATNSVMDHGLGLSAYQIRATITPLAPIGDPRLRAVTAGCRQHDLRAVQRRGLGVD
jgi:hypothetical protein